jgi:hypothetical protein
MQRIVDVRELFLSMVIANADQIADQAAPGSGESMFTIEAALFRHLQDNLPEMIRNVDEAALLDHLEHRPRGEKDDDLERLSQVAIDA